MEKLFYEKPQFSVLETNFNDVILSSSFEVDGVYDVNDFYIID